MGASTIDDGAVGERGDSEQAIATTTARPAATPTAVLILTNPQQLSYAK
jgi:hypothetical protein